MQTRITYLGLLVGAWLTIACDDKPKTDDGTMATPDPSAMTKLLATASAMPATSGGSAPSSSAAAEATPAREVSYAELGKLVVGPAIVRFKATVIEHSKCDCEGKDCKPCLKYVIVSEGGAEADQKVVYDKTKHYAVLTPGNPDQYPLGKQFEFSVTVTPNKQVGGELNDLRLVYATPL